MDDELSIRKVLGAQLRKQGHEVLSAADGQAAVQLLSAEPVDAVITDLKMPGMDGLSLLRWVQDAIPGLPVILITAHGTVDVAVEALKRGAYDFITKPFDQDELRDTLDKALATRKRSAQDAVSPPQDADLIGSNPAMRRAWAVIERIAPSTATVLVTGEPGTGKAFVAKAIHRRSDRADGPFISIACSAIPERLFEAELFGYEPGALQGPVTQRPGRVELAHGGTLFLDEVGALPKDLQVRLLRVLRDGAIDRIGGTQSIPVDVRVVAASDEDLTKLVRDGRLREDLYYRLNVIPIQLAPLRERREDLPTLVQHFLTRFRERFGTPARTLADDALSALQRHGWPGNLRELENLLERAALLADGPVLHASDLAGFQPSPAESAPDAREGEDLDLKDYLRLHTARLERYRIRRALEADEGNVTRAAKRLGISRRSLQTKMKDYGLREH